MQRLLLCTVLFSAAAVAAPAPAYHVVNTIHIGGEGGWDYIYMDAAARRLYVSHATKVVVVDADTGKITGEIPDTQGVHGVAVAAKLGRGFTSNGRENTVSIFDLKTLALLKKVKVGENPDAIIYEPVSNRVFTFNGRSKDATALDAATGEIAGTIPLGGKPEFSVVDGRGRLYVNNEDTNEIMEIDPRGLKVMRRSPLTGCEAPSGLAFDVPHHRLFSVCSNKVMVVTDSESGKVVGTAPIGAGCDGVAFDEGFAFSSNGGDGTVTVAGESGGKYTAVATVPTARSARTITVDPKTHNLYLPAAEYVPAPQGEGRQGQRPQMAPDSFHLIVLGR
jgi:DNA-binding beta-propeller fold protein YncE